MNSFFSPSKILGYAASMIVLLGGAVAAEPRADDSSLRAVVIVSRHSVRTPLATPEQHAPYALQAWPKWETAPGLLTPRGRQLAVLMGAYYRARYTDSGLLTGRTSEDKGRIFFRANNFERTLATAHSLAQGLLGEDTEKVQAVAADAVDPLFMPVKAHIGHPDAARAIAAIQGRVGGDVNAFLQTYRPQFLALQNLLFDGQPVPAGKVSLLDVPWVLKPAKDDSDVVVAASGGLTLSLSFTENMLLEYAEGRPAPGWGRASHATLAELLKLHALYFDLTQRTFYPAQVQASNLASHVLLTLEQAATGRATPGAFGTPAERLFVIVGHDTNIANLGGLLGLSWSVDGLPASPTLPGGALVFELWQRTGDAKFFVRTYYMTQTLDQMRSVQTLSRKTPPAIAPIFVPGCGTAGTDCEAPLDQFAAHVRGVIDPEFVTR